MLLGLWAGIMNNLCDMFPSQVFDELGIDTLKLVGLAKQPMMKKCIQSYFNKRLRIIDDANDRSAALGIAKMISDYL